jgi:hypothetical protein
MFIKNISERASTLLFIIISFFVDLYVTNENYMNNRVHEITSNI